VKLTKQLAQPVKFDQHGILTRQLGIKAVPSMVTFDGKQPHLTITEVDVSTLPDQEARDEKR